MKTDIYLHASKENNREEGERLGLAGDALENFTRACYEVKITGDVDCRGQFTITHVDDREVKQ